MQHQRTIYLLEQYASGQISETELSEFLRLIEADPAQGQVPEAIREWLEARDSGGVYDPQHWQPVLNNVLLTDKEGSRNTIRTIPVYRRAWFRYAAAVLIVFGAAAWWWSNSSSPAVPEQIVQTDTVRRDVEPGKDGAILTLADGTNVVLDSLGNGVVAKQNGTQVILKAGQLTYFGSDKKTATVVYNTMTTPKGRQFNVRLPDGTQVWLNAASSLRYPTVFNGTERKVAVTGEAYFEVVKNKTMPFKVTVNGHTEIEVLGTHFNVNAYDDEPGINTTLLEGSVKLISSGHEVVIKPGEQAQIGQDASSAIKVQQVDVKQVVAWKDGVFAFDDADLSTVMRQLARWYNLEVEYVGDKSKGVYNGKIGRGLTLTEVLDGVSGSARLKFRIEEGNKIVVMP